MRTRRQTSGFPRVNCLVPGCRRGTTRMKPLEPGQRWLDQIGLEPRWICAEHWRRIPRSLRRRRRWVNRKWAAVERQGWPPGNPELADRIIRLAIVIWDRCEQHARGERIVIYSSERLPAHMIAELQREGLL